MVTPARKIGDDLFAIQSFNGDHEYIVNLAAGTCSCKHHQCRGAFCKHLAEVKRQAPRIELLEKARSLGEPQREALLKKYATDPLIGGALRVARAEAKTEQSLRDIFA